MNCQNCSENMYKNKNMPILLLVDIEGIIGVSSMSNMRKNIELTYQELSFVISKLKKANFNNITVCNIHDDGKCLKETRMKKFEVELIQGIQNLVPIAKNYAYTIMLGFHGKKGSGGRFDHTFRDDICMMYYGKKNVGEVGAFYRWLMLNENIVVMISGEGNFKEEVNKIPIIIHKTDIKSIKTNEIKKIYKDLDEKLYSAIKVMKQENVIIEKIIKEKVRITVNNCDAYYRTSERFKRTEDNQAFEFLSLQNFFEEVYDFSLELNRVGKKICSNNIRFFNNIKKQFKKVELEKYLYDYMEKDIEEIDYVDRKAIKDKLGINYEDF